MRGTPKPPNERGFALLIVLWSLILITLLTMQILASGRTALALAGNLKNAAEARASADGAINEALFHLLAAGSGHWPADGQPHALGAAGIGLTVQISPLDNLINPNNAAPALLAGLFQASGAPPVEAKQLAAAIVAWRAPAGTKSAGLATLAAYRAAGLPYGPPGRPFQDLGELAYVIGMKPALLAKALPDLSLYQSTDPQPAQASPAVREALFLSGQPAPKANAASANPPVVTITAEVTGPGKLDVRRTAIVSIAGGNKSPPYAILALTDATQ
jgi:general secretion pathway protein K